MNGKAGEYDGGGVGGGGGGGGCGADRARSTDTAGADWQLMAMNDGDASNCYYDSLSSTRTLTTPLIHPWRILPWRGARAGPLPWHRLADWLQIVQQKPEAYGV